MIRTFLIYAFSLTLLLSSCIEDSYIDGDWDDITNNDSDSSSDNENPSSSAEESIDLGGESIIVCCEGAWQWDNGQLAFYNGATGKLINQWFRQKNGIKLGDTPNDIIQLNDTLIAIAVNWSNIIQFIRPDGTACGATEEIPNNRRMCSDGKYLYVTSYAHVCGTQYFEKGYVAKIDLKTKNVIATCEVGWEPEGVKEYKGKLYVANTGGYSYSENHEYESTISVVDAESMTIENIFDTGCINLYSEMSQAGQYLCVNSVGDYYGTPGCTVVFDCETGNTITFEHPATCNTTDGQFFYTMGTDFSYDDEGYSQVYIRTINPEDMTSVEEIYNATVTEKLKKLKSPYEIYISPYTKNIYFTDAMDYGSSGRVYGYSKDGKEVIPELKVYMNPAHILALPRKK